MSAYLNEWTNVHTLSFQTRRLHNMQLNKFFKINRN
jgi:hypothetical protein